MGPLLSPEEFGNFQDHLRARLTPSSPLLKEGIASDLLLILSDVHAICQLTANIEAAALVINKDPIVLSAMARTWGMNKPFKA